MRAEQIKLLAFVCRYGHVPLSDVLRTETVFLQDFAVALAEIVKQENKAT